MDIEEIVPEGSRPKPRGKYERAEQPYIATNDPVRFLRLIQQGKVSTGIHVVEIRRIDSIPDGFAVLVRPGELMMSWPVFDYRTETERRLDPMYQIGLQNARAALLGTLNAMLEEATECGKCDGTGYTLSWYYENGMPYQESNECDNCGESGKVFWWNTDACPFGGYEP